MKRTNLLFLFLLVFFVSSKAQEAVTLTFTANTTQGGMYCPFDAVSVTNVTRGWTETLAYPDTVLLLNSTVGLGEQFWATFRLGEAHPNPFTDETVISLETSVTGEVCIQVFRIDGTVIVKSHNHLEAGTHKVRVSLHSPGMSFLVATSAQGRQVVRLLCTGNGGGDHIIVEPVSREYTPSGQFMRGDAMGEFQPGDMMRYTGVLYDGANTIYSNTITQQQFESQIVTLYFDLTIPEVTTNQVIDITQTTATGVGNVTSTGGVSVTERGICWSTSHNPTINSSHASNGAGSGTYTIQMNGLTAGTTYYVCAYAINMFGIAYGNEVSFTTTQIPNYTISVSANPTNGGTVSGGGSYQQGQGCTVIATAANGYGFANWTENGNVVSTTPNYSFTVNNSRDLVAIFSVQAPNTYTINASPNPSNGGVVTGGGTYQQGQSCTISASANTGYTFLRWTENGNQVSTNANYTFTVTGNRTLVAQFQLQSFTISATVTPGNSGTVTGEGSYNYGQTCTLVATANTGYVFEKWTENGTQVSTEATYSFTVTESASYVAHFQLQNYTISVSANPSNGGNVTGGGSYNYGQSCTLSATSSTGFSFTNWTESGSVVSTDANYTFTVTSNRTLVAQFQSNATIPTVMTAQITSITPTTANGGGNVTATGGANVTERGICWSTSHNPTTSDNHASSGTGTGSFTVSMTGLTANTTYYVRAYAINSVGTAYGSEVSFTTQEITLPSVTTNGYVYPITQTTAQTFGFVDSMGNGWVSERGICWSTSHNPTTSGNHANNGQGTGSFGVEITGLTASTTYYIRAYAINEAGTAYGNEVSFTTLSNIINYSITVIPIPTAGGTVTGGGIYQQGQSCTVSATANTGYTFVGWTENEIVVSTNANYTFTVNSDRTLVAYFSAQAPNTYTISVSSSPTNGGSVTGGGTYQQGQSCTVSATANTGYTFLRWTENGNQVSTNANYTFTVTGNRTLVAQFQTSATAPTVTTTQVTNITQTTASGCGNVTNSGGSTVSERGICWSTSHNPTTSGNHASSGTGTGAFTVNMTGLTAGTTYYVRAYAINMFGTAYGNEVSFTTTQIPNYTISVSANPTNGGLVTGGGTYQQGQSCTVTATAGSGYYFVIWTENGNPVSTNSNYTFTVNSNRTLVANFSLPPTGAINGLFSVSATQQVFFSKGNLIYLAYNNRWRFATHQYDYIGNDNSNISQTYDDWIDLFGWGTSGWDCGSTYYHPWDFQYPSSGSYGPPVPYNLTDEYANSDWGGYNGIHNGGYEPGLWRTLTADEWAYIFSYRETTSGWRYTKAQVNGVNGVILLPDDWNTNYYNLSYSNASYTVNVIDISSWMNILEAHGCVFLPAAGRRYQTMVDNVGSYGYYWSASHYDNDSTKAYGLFFDGSYLNLQYDFPRFIGCSVRLVKDY